MAHEKGRAHEFTPDEARVAGRKGGQKISRNREHMARIGRAGGQARARSTTKYLYSEVPQQGVTNATTLLRFFGGMNFPASKQQVIDRIGNTDPSAVDALVRCNLVEFTSVDQVNDEIVRNALPQSEKAA